MKLSALLLVSVILTAATGGMAGGWQRNQAALETMGVCLKGLPAISHTEDFENEDLLWFAALQSMCAGDAEKEKRALIQALANSATRLNAVRALMPEEIELAALAAETHPNNSQAQFWYGNLLAASGNRAEAILAYERGLEFKPLDGVAWVFLGGLYEDSGDWGAALQAYDKGCLYHDRGGNGCPSAGRIYLQHQFYELAVDRYQRSIQQIRGFYAPSEYGLAMALISLDRSDEAIPHLKELANRGDEKGTKALEKLEIALP